MRIPITVDSQPFDMESAQPGIDKARRAFADYLGDYLKQVSGKSTRSKHGLMGPIGKILSEIKSGRGDAESLKGYALNAHEAAVARARKGAGRATLSSAAMTALGQGISTIVDLLGGVPVQFHDRIVDRLDYGLYWELRKRQADSKEARRQLWIAYVREKYGTLEALAAGWDLPAITFEELYLPKKDEGSRAKKATARQIDVADFWETQGVSMLAAEEED